MLLLTTPQADLTKVACLVLDIDDFLWPQAQFEDKEPDEIAAVARELRTTSELLKPRILKKREELGRRWGRRISIYEVFLALGVDGGRLDILRQEIYKPSQHITRPDQQLCELILSLSVVYRLAFGTNSPVAIGEEVLTLLGIRNLVDPKQAPVWGYANLLRCFKPNPMFFTQLACEMEWKPQHCLSLGNSEHHDGHAAIAGGFAGALILPEGRDQFLAVGQHVVRAEWDRLRTLCTST